MASFLSRRSFVAGVSLLAAATATGARAADTTSDIKVR